MASIDEIFNGAKSSGSKRKNEAIRDPNEIYKSARGGNTTPRHFKADGDGDDVNMEAGPAAAPPGNDEDEDFGPSLPEDDDDGGDDDEGRFFGGGISKTEQEALDFLQEDDGLEEVIDEPWLRRKLIALEKNINKNAELRAKFADEPQKFIASEADLDASIKDLLILSEYPALYKVLEKMGSVASLVGLLAHENTDIAIDVLQLLAELTDNDVDAEQDQWHSLVMPAMEADFLDLLESNLVRFNDDNDDDEMGVSSGLTIVENLMARRDDSVCNRIGSHKPLIKYLLSRASRAEPTQISENKQYSAEVLAIIVQSCTQTCDILVSLDAVDALLQLVAPYRRKDPAKGSSEEEYMGNLFEILVALAESIQGKAKFLEAEGVELCLLLITDAKLAKAPALRLLGCVAGIHSDLKAAEVATQVCIRIVEAAGLKPLFSTFYKTKDRRKINNLLAIFAVMLQLLPLDEAPRIRLLAKWVEKDYQKLHKVISMRAKIARALENVDKEHGVVDGKAEFPADDDDAQKIQYLSDQIEAGMGSLEHIDLILAWLVTEDAGVASKVKQEVGYDRIIATFNGMMKSPFEESQNEDKTDMLTTLISFLQ
ncbi:hypothetical protein BROUX41_002252 [Berkeleyomyces rouxiae]